MNVILLLLKTDNQGETRQMKRGNILKNFHKNFVCKTKAKLANKEDISVVEIAITWAPGILRVVTNNLTNGQNLRVWVCPIQLGVCRCCKLPLCSESKEKL